MKSHGFTLVELLGVIVILSLLVILIFPTVNDVISDSKNTLYQTQINTILNAAYDYTLKNTDYLPNSNEKKYITLAQLKIEGLIDVDIKNPDNNQKFEDDLVISISNVGTNYHYENINSNLEGDYLYTVETEQLVYTGTLSPTIELEGFDINSNNVYVLPLNLNQTFYEVDYQASYSKVNPDIDITDDVKKYILKDNKIVESVDTSNQGIYKINYIVVNSAGYASKAILNIIVADTIPPTITFPEETVVSKDLTDYDLMKNVFCEDNSGFCEIEYSNEIDYDVTGAQTIEYIVKDPSGNTDTKKRVIIVE